MGCPANVPPTVPVKNVTPVLQPGPPRYDVGVEFEDVDASAREFLERFVESRA